MFHLCLSALEIWNARLALIWKQALISHIRILFWLNSMRNACDVNKNFQKMHLPFKKEKKSSPILFKFLVKCHLMFFNLAPVKFWKRNEKLNISVWYFFNCHNSQMRNFHWRQQYYFCHGLIFAYGMGVVTLIVVCMIDLM